MIAVNAENGEKEAEFIAGMIRQKMNENPDLTYQDFAILYRSNHLSRELEDGLRQAEIPYTLVGGQEFYNRKEIKDAVAYLKLVVNPRDNQSFLRILPTPPRGLAQKAVDSLKELHQIHEIPMLYLLRRITGNLRKVMTLSRRKKNCCVNLLRSRPAVNLYL